MTRQNHLAAILVLGALAFGPLVSGCATKGYVNDRLDELRRTDEENLAAMQAESSELRNSAEDALERARTALDSAEEARDLALGNAGLEELNRYTVYFRFNSDAIDDDQKTTLGDAADEIRQHPEAIVDVYGFADPKGSDRYNLELGQRRAMEVVRYLAGAAPNQLSRYAAVSFGERELAGMPPDDGNDARSRRVVISLIRRIPLRTAPPSSATLHSGS